MHVLPGESSGTGSHLTSEVWSPHTCKARHGKDQSLSSGALANPDCDEREDKHEAYGSPRPAWEELCRAERTRDAGGRLLRPDAIKICHSPTFLFTTRQQKPLNSLDLCM